MDIAKCHVCGKPATIMYESRKLPGWRFWKCEACGEFFADENGKIGAAFSAADYEKLTWTARIKPERWIMETQKIPVLDIDKCPVCGKPAIRYESKQSGWFWKCRGKNGCGRFFSDDDGKPQALAECPECREMALDRFESEKRPGVHYWSCQSCQSFFGDNQGFPGAAFGAEETTSCPGCDGQAIRRIFHETEEWYWHCDVCGDFRDVDGVIGAPRGEAVQ